MNSPLICSSHYLPGPEVLLVQADMSEYLVDYYLHLKDHGGIEDPQHDSALKELIISMAVHLAIRPPGGSHAWTVHMVSEKPYSIFVAGGIDEYHPSGEQSGFIIGNVLTENIRHTDVNSLHAQFVDPAGGSFKSFVRCESSHPLRMIEHFYGQSEQVPLRLAAIAGTDRVVGLAALPGHDRAWFDSADLPSLDRGLPGEFKRMRGISYFFRCDCSAEKLLPFFRALDRDALNELYGHDRELIIACPRCGRKFAVGRESVDL